MLSRIVVVAGAAGAQPGCALAVLPKVAAASLGATQDRSLVVVLAVRAQYPPVVLARLDAIQLVAAARPELRGPDLAGHRMQRQAGRVAMTERVDLRSKACLADERVVLRDGAVV